MTAPTRRRHAANVPLASRTHSDHEMWREAVKIRQEGLDHGLSTQPADRATAERSLTAIYARISRPRPRFCWVDSPRQALPLIGGLPTLDVLYRWIRDPSPPGSPPLASDLAAAASSLRGRLSQAVVHTDPELSPVRPSKIREVSHRLPPLEALTAGVPFGVVVHQGVRAALYRSLASGFYLPVRGALASYGPVAVCWYGQQDASWVAYYDALYRLGLARYAPDDADHLADWAALVRSCGWWWSDEEVCVVAERPETVRTTLVPGTWHEEVQLSVDGLVYRDGWRPSLR
ncbi:MAG: hypothetical protein ACRDT6_24820 [Micromonosporaceae bacterium]